MAMQSCRTALRPSRQICRMASMRSAANYSMFANPTNPTPESFKISETESSETPAQAPRWSQTPLGMKAPIQMDRAVSPENKIWTVNSDPKVLDEMYNRLLGQGGSRMLPEELKWLAVTHKSFDQGRRGFNDRLALMGRMTLIMEATKAIVSKDAMKGTKVVDEFSGEREAFENQQLQSIDNLYVNTPHNVVGKEKLYTLGTELGMLDVLRWKPRLPGKLEASGVEVVMVGAIYAIIGAITLQHGSVVAAKVVRERILARVQRNLA